MLKLTKLQFFKILILYISLALAAFCCFNISNFLAPPRKRPFECDDESLKKPFLHDTISSQHLYVLGVYFPLVLITVFELHFCFAVRKPGKSFSWTLKWVLKSCVILTLYLIGLAVERLYKNVAKIKMARLRPNFIAVCNPYNSNGERCSNLYDGFQLKMDEYECSGTSYPAWADSTPFSSFPSGHASLISYSMVFIIGYLHLLIVKMGHLKYSTTIVILIMQSQCFFTMLFVSISRVLDFKHHWSDIVAGSIGGSAIALVLSYYLKSQMENIEKWLEAVVACEIARTDGINENVAIKEETCVIELH